MISGHLLPTFCFWCPFQLFSHWITQHLPPCWNSSQALLNIIRGNLFQFYLGVFFLLSHLFSIYSAFGQIVGLWLTTFFSVFEKYPPFLVKYLSFLHLKLWPWNKKLHQCVPSCSYFISHFVLNHCAPTPFILHPKFHSILLRTLFLWFSFSCNLAVDSFDQPQQALPWR